MNKIYKMFALAGMVAMFGACNEDPEYYVLEDQPDEMHIKAQLGANSNAEKNLVTLAGAYSSDDAVELTWSSIKSNDPVSYLIRFYATESKNDNYTNYICSCTDPGCAYEHNIGKFTSENGVNKFTITHNDLNTIVARWAYPGDEISITAQVVGTIKNELTYIKPQTSTVSLNVVGWEKYPVSLIAYITDAKGKQSTIELTQKTLGTGVYTADVTATAYSVYFQKPVSSKQAASYYKGEDGKLKYIEEDIPNAPVRETEEQFTFNTAGTLMVDVNDEYLDVQVLNLNMPAGANPYIVGDGTDIGWTTKVASGYMIPSSNPRTPYIYSYTGQFYAQGEFPGKTDSEGTFKILVDDNFSSNGFFAPALNANPLENHELPKAGANSGSDYKWLVPATGKYTFTIDVMNMTTSFVPAN